MRNIKISRMKFLNSGNLNMNLIFIPKLFVFLLISVNSCKPDFRKGEIEVFQTKHGKLFTKIYSNHNFSDAWSLISQFKNQNISYLVLYDKNKGLIEILDPECKSIKILKGFKRNFTILTVIDINGDGNDELLFFAPGKIIGNQYSQGTMDFFTITDKFQFKLLKSDSAFHNYWRDIISYDFDNDGKRELLFYDPSEINPDSISAEMYSLDKDCKFILINKFSWAKTWKILTPIKTESFTGILLYGYSNGKTELLNYNQLLKTFTLINSIELDSKEIDKIIPGNYGIHGKTNLLFFDKDAGSISFYSIFENTLKKVNESLDLAEPWEIILPFANNGTTTDNLIFYKRQREVELEIPTYDGSGEAVHPDILMLNKNDYRLTFTPYPKSNDIFENPSILESGDGIHFQKIQNAKPNPIIYHPTPTDYDHAHNNDPDYYFENNKEYIIFQQTLYQLNSPNSRILDLDMMLLVSDDKWSSFKTSVILKERNKENPYSITASPCLIKKDSIYYLFYVNVTFDGRNAVNSRIQYLKSNNIFNWEFKGNPPEGNNISTKNIDLKNSSLICPWHIDIILNTYDKNYYMFIAGNVSKLSTTENSLYIAKSHDLTNWALFSEPIISIEEIHKAKQIYRSTGIFRDYDILDIYYSYQTINKSWYISLRKNYSIKGLFPNNDSF